MLSVDETLNADIHNQDRCLKMLMYDEQISKRYYIFLDPFKSVIKIVTVTHIMSRDKNCRNTSKWHFKTSPKTKKSLFNLDFICWSAHRLSRTPYCFCVPVLVRLCCDTTYRVNCAETRFTNSAQYPIMQIEESPSQDLLRPERYKCGYSIHLSFLHILFL